MRDIIRKAGFIQGAIYRYYSNLDKIYIDLINKSTTYNILEQKIDALLSSSQPEKTILSECILAIGIYVEELLKSVGGKTCFEVSNQRESERLAHNYMLNHAKDINDKDVIERLGKYDPYADNFP